MAYPNISLSGTVASITLPSGLADMPSMPPPEFDGPPGYWSPETLLASALGLSLFTAFDVFAARDNVAVFAKVRDEENIDGLVVTVIDRKGEAVFVNIVGNISADKIAAYTSTTAVFSIKTTAR